MTIYVRPHRLGGTTTPGAAPLPRSVGTDPFAAPVDPLDPKTTVYWDMAVTEAELPPVGLVIAASEVSYDDASSDLGASNVQSAIDVLDDRLDAVAGSEPATEAEAGIAEIATQAEVDAGTDDGRIVSPLKLAPLVARVTAAEADVDALQAADAALDSRLDTAEGSITNLQGRMTTTEGEVDALQAVDVTLDSRLDTAEGSITTLQGQMTVAEGDIDNLQAADVVLDGRLDAAESDITALEGKTNQATEAAAGIAELATQAEVNAGADDVRIITPLKLRNLNGWHVGPLGIGAAATAGQLHVIGPALVGACIESTAADQARLVLKNTLRQWIIYNRADGLFSIHDSNAVAERLVINTNGSISINAGVDASFVANIGNAGTGLANVQARLVTTAAQYVRWQYVNNQRTWAQGVGDTGLWILSDESVPAVRMTIDQNGTFYFNNIPGVDSNGRFVLRQYANASRPAPATVADGVMIYVPDSPVAPFQLKHGGTYYGFSPVACP